MRKKIIWIGAAASPVVALLISVSLPITIALFAGTSSGGQAQACGTSNVILANPLLSPEQRRIAGIIIATGAQLSRAAGLSVADTLKAETIGIVTGYGESSLTNVLHGDVAGPDSIGVFQQRPRWGSLAARTNPVQATALFYTANVGPGVMGLFHTAGWQQMTVTAAAHAVQHNTDPNYYAQFGLMASQLVGQANGGSVVPALLSVGCPPATSSGGTFAWPVLLAGSSVSSCYGPRTLLGVSEFHPGLDISQAHGAPVYAAASGIVTIAGPVLGYGNNFVSIISENHSFELQYGHMMAMSVTVGQKVTQGQQIGQVGSEGASFGDHLHLNDIRVDLPHNPYNGNVDPLQNGLNVPAGVPNPNGCS